MAKRVYVLGLDGMMLNMFDGFMPGRQT